MKNLKLLSATCSLVLLLASLNLTTFAEDVVSTNSQANTSSVSEQVTDEDSSSSLPESNEATSGDESEQATSSGNSSSEPKEELADEDQTPSSSDTPSSSEAAPSEQKGITESSFNFIVEGEQATVIPKIDMSKIDLKSVIKNAKSRRSNILTAKMLEPSAFLLAEPTTTEDDATRAVNTPPVADLVPVILNEETLKDGQITTQTQIAFFWSDGETDFTYDPDGDAITDIYLGGIPLEWIITQIDVGFAIQIPDAGTYTMYYQVRDARGALSNIYAVEIKVIPYETYQEIEDSFSAQDEVKTHTISIDYSITPSAFLYLQRTGNSGVFTAIKDANGAAVASADVYSPLAIEGNYNEPSYTLVNLPKPSGLTGDVATFTITAQTRAKHFYAGSSGYKIVTGDTRDIESLVGGLGNAIPYTPAYLTEKGTYTKGKHISSYIPNQNELFFSYTPDTSLTTVTLTSSGDSMAGKNLQIKVLDANSFVELYNSSGKNDYMVETTSTKFTRKARLGIPVGRKCYIVVYTPKNLQNSSTSVIGNFAITIGAPEMRFGTATISASSSATGTQTQYSNWVSVDARSIPKTAFMESISIYNGVHSRIYKNWKLTTPAQNTSTYYNTTKADFPYSTNLDSNVKGNGIWEYQFKSSNDDYTYRPEFGFSYYYEIGDYVPTYA